MHEDPLSVRPSVVVLGVECECLGREVELAGRIVEREDDGPAVLPGTQAKHNQNTVPEWRFSARRERKAHQT